jgi:enamine deaminase RidA (YjgF/YER057c/UK114 family)
MNVRRDRKLISFGSEFESKWGYSRAVVDGHDVFVSGTTGFDYATMTISDDAATQARTAFANVEAALREAGATLSDVVRVRYYVARAADWPSIGAIAGDVFTSTRPAATAIVCGLVDPRMLIEIEVTARIRAQRTGAG